LGPARAVTPPSSSSLASASALALALALAVASCAPRTLAPLGEAVVVVDTDLPVPLVASALRVDLYDGAGVWIESRDIVLRDPRDWPASFSVQAADELRNRDLVVRVRVHGGRMRDVLGGARLVVNGADVTPSSEPEPALAVDRLLLVRLRPGERGRAVVIAHASCAGTAAQLDPNARASCVEGEGTLEPLTVAPLDPDLSTPTRSVAGSAASSACRFPSDVRLCVDGGAFVIGADDVQVVPDPTLPLAPPRIARVHSFKMNRDEVTVGDLRNAIAHGFVAPDPIGMTEGDLGGTPDTSCSFSTAPRGREDFAATCITWRTARAYCMRFDDGGDLPTEAQWEYAATSAARTGKATFPWGDDAPDCVRAVYGRLTLAGLPGACEKEAGTGPRPVTMAGAPIAPGDVSATKIRGLGGGVAEWTRDTPATYDAPCWRGIDASCNDPATDAHVVRGGAWASTAINVRSTSRLASRKATSFIGFRCVDPG
jgi:formylglycine-generating enzyme required for sulfatase activity